MTNNLVFLQKNQQNIWSVQKKAVPLHPLSSRKRGAIAQLVEQRTENPCVPGSIPGGTTKKTSAMKSFLFSQGCDKHRGGNGMVTELVIDCTKPCMFSAKQYLLLFALGVQATNQICVPRE